MIRRSAPGFVLAGMLLALGVSSAALADPWQSYPFLSGKYSYTGEGSCLYSPSGFNMTTLSPNGFSFSSEFSVTGVWAWDGQGYSSLAGRIVSLSFAPSVAGTSFQPGATSVDVKAVFKSSPVADDGSFTETMVSFQGTYLTGPRAGQTFTFDKAQELGMVGPNRKTLTLATTEPTVENMTISGPGGNVLQSLQRICQGTRILTKISE